MSVSSLYGTGNHCTNGVITTRTCQLRQRIKKKNHCYEINISNTFSNVTSVAGFVQCCEFRIVDDFLNLTKLSDLILNVVI